MSRSDVFAVVPAYQCERTIRAVAAGLRTHLDRVIVVSDGSRDHTVDEARAAGAEVEELAENRGKGFALRHGLVRALAEGASAIVLLDGDGQHAPGDLPAFLELWDAERPDLIVGSRLGDRDPIPGVRYWTNYIGSRILSWMTGSELLDSQSGYRLLSARLAGGLPLCSNGYAIESEMLIKAAARGTTARHVRITTIYNDGGSHFRPVLDTFRISCASIYFKVFDPIDDPRS